MTQQKNADIAQTSFEEAMKELEGIVRSLEGGSQALDKSIENYSRGSALKEHCERKLKEASLKVEKITISADGKLTAKPAKLEE